MQPLESRVEDEGACSEAEREICLKVLRALARQPERFVDKRDPDKAALHAVRAAANRLIAGIQGQVRLLRGQMPDGSGPIPRAHRAAEANATAVESPAAEPYAARKCYLCRLRFRPVSNAEELLCPNCQQLNAAKRQQSADLSGRTALVTGGRVRIGYQTALKLLRAGASVHVTSRFVVDAWQRYQREPDFAAWRDRLWLHGVDFRSIPAVLRLGQQLAVSPLDILINNAAQTVRRPAGHYAELAAREAANFAALPAADQAQIERHAYHAAPSLKQFFALPAPTDAAAARASLAEAIDPQPLTAADLAIARRLPEDWAMSDGDANAAMAATEDFDPRRATSWTQTVDTVHPGELLEVQAVNACAPFVLLQQLLPALRRSTWPRRFVIQVTAREGSFSAPKDAVHPHTNMAKAALNMLTRTTASDLAREGIYVNSVDPGWVSLQKPPSSPDAATLVPLTAEDGAARILDPVFRGVLDSAVPQFGKLLRNFGQVAW